MTSSTQPASPSPTALMRTLCGHEVCWLSADMSKSLILWWAHPNQSSDFHINAYELETLIRKLFFPYQCSGLIFFS